MPDMPAHLVADIPRDTAASALRQWEWLIGADKIPVMVTASGDLFLLDPGGGVHFLDTGAGSLARIAGSLQEFETAAHDFERLADWFMIPVVEQLRERHAALAPGQCYTYKTLPIFGGRYGADNRTPVDAAEHLRFCGAVHREARRVSAGTGAVP